MSNRNFEVYFDFGASKIRATAINVNEPTKKFCYESNDFSDYLKSEKEIEKIISNIEKDTNEYLDSINLMVDNSKMLSINLSLSKNFDGSKLKKEDIQFLVQDAKQQVLRNYLNQNIIHVIIKNYRINNTNYTFLPSNIICNTLSVDIIFICLPKTIIEDLNFFFYKFDISINQIFCSSYVKSLSYKDNFTSIENLSFIDIGFNKTSIICYKNNEVCFFEVIPIGSNNITKDLSKVLNIDLTEAENIKLCLSKNENIVIKKKLSLELIQKIVISRVEEILELCMKSINLEQFVELKIILIGGGSRIIDNQFKKKISFLDKVDLLEETTEDICGAALKLSQGLNKQEVIMVAKRQIKEGFFEKLFHFFR